MSFLLGPGLLTGARFVLGRVNVYSSKYRVPNSRPGQTLDGLRRHCGVATAKCWEKRLPVLVYLFDYCDVSFLEIDVYEK